MKTNHFSIWAVILCVICTGFAMADFGPDPYAPDTVRIEGGPLVVGQSIPLTMTLVNDEVVASITIPSEISSIDSGFAVWDSVVYINRMMDPMTLDYRNMYLRDFDSLSPDSFQWTGAVFTSNPLPVGNTAIAEFYFTGLAPGMMSWDTATFRSIEMHAVNVTGMLVWQPQFNCPNIEVLAGFPPPAITFDDEIIHVVAGTQVSMDIYATSPEEFPISFEPLEMSEYDDDTESPANNPFLTGNDPAVFSWNSTTGDIGIWRVTVGVCDSSGICTYREFQIHVVSDADYLVSFVHSGIDGPGNASSLVHGNYDDDTEPEVIVSGNYHPSMKIYDQLSAGVWDDIYTANDDSLKVGLQSAYVDSDNYLDLIAITHYSSGTYHTLVHLGNGDMTFDVVGSENDGTFTRGTALGEFTGDNHLDLAVVTNSGLLIYAGNSAGGFTHTATIYPSGTTLSVNSADFDDDGYDDLAIGTGGGVNIYLSDGSGGFSLENTYSQTYGSMDIEITNQGSDFNNDNVFDLCISTPSVAGEYSEMMVYLGNGDGSFDQEAVRSVNGHIFGNCVADFNNDGELDIAYVNGAEEYLSIMFGDGDGSFSNELRYVVPHTNPKHIDCFDADLDGDIDIMIAANATTFTGHMVYYYENQLDPEGFSALNFNIMACDNVEMELTSEGGKVFNSVKSTMPGGNLYQRNIDGNEILDNYASLNVVEDGQYKLMAEPRPDLAEGEMFTMEYYRNGELYRLAKDIPMNSEGYQFTLYPADVSGILPRSGKFVSVNPPTFTWTGEGEFDFQLARDIDFTDLVIETPVTGNGYTLPTALDVSNTSPYYWRIKSSGAPDYDCLYAINMIDASPTNCGDANNDGQTNVGDAVQLINYIFKYGPAPDPLCQGDADGNYEVNVGDAVYLIQFIFRGGPAPVGTCCP